MPFGTVVIVFFAMVFAVGALAMLMEHMQKMARIRSDAPRRIGTQVEDALRALRQEMADLRDTTTKYDLSFDTALQRLDARVSQLEHRVGEERNVVRQ